MRLAAGVAVLLLSACSQDTGSSPPDPGALIECALGGAEDFARDCAVERSREGGASFLVVRHPDGSFRRFEVLADGGGLASADGAEPAQLAIEGDGIAVTVGLARYRFPARLAVHDGQ